jgi:membrane protein required for colicin V production
MNWLDVILLLILAVSVFTSFRKGFSREVISLVAVVLALVLGIWFYGTAGAYLVPYLSSRSAANFGGFLLVFCGVLLIGGLVSFIVGKFLKVTGLSIFDHALGAGFGAIRGIVISIALIMAIIAFSPGGQTPGSVVRSRIAPYVTGAASALAAVAPYELKQGFHETYAHVKETWHSALSEKAADAQSGKERE